MARSAVTPAARSDFFRGAAAAATLATVWIAAGMPRAEAAGVVDSCTWSSLEAALAGGGLVRFECSGTIQPTTPMVIDADTTLDALGHSVVLDGEELFRLHARSTDGLVPMFLVQEGLRLELRGLTITGMINNHYKILLPGNPSGAVFNLGTVVVDRTTFRNNIVIGDAGRISAAIINHGLAEIHNSLFMQNGLQVGRTGFKVGGAIWSAGTLLVNGTLFVDNGELDADRIDHQDLTSSGGAILLHGGSAFINESIFVGNSAGHTGANQSAGAIYCDEGVSLTIERSEFSNNGGWVGAVGFFGDGQLIVDRSTFAGNRGWFVGTIFLNHDVEAVINGSSFTGNVGLAGSSVNFNRGPGIPADLAPGAGVIFNRGALEITDTALRDNTGNAALVNAGSGSVALVRAVIAGNSNINDGDDARMLLISAGAGIWNAGRLMSIDGSVITDNRSSLGVGTILNLGGTMEIRSSEISRNQTLGGGGILNFSGSVSIANSTFFGNVAASTTLVPTCGPFPICPRENWLVNEEDLSRGGAIFNAGIMTLRNVTVADNVAERGGLDGDGIFNALLGSATLYNTLMVAAGPDAASCLSWGLLISFNTLADSGNCAYPIPVSRDRVPLGEPTGSPAVLPLLNGNEAIDRGNNDVCAGSPVNGVDQSGVARPQDGDGDGLAVCDIGAFESTNHKPGLTVDVPAVVVDEGRVASVSGRFSDADGDFLGLRASIGTIAPLAGDRWNWTFVAEDGPTDSAQVTVTADDGAARGSVTFDLVVRNVAPTVVVPGPSAALASGDNLRLSAHYVDPSRVDTHTATVDFGLGAGPQPASVVVLAPGQGRVQAETRYLSPGSFVVTVCVADDDGGRGCASSTVEVSPVAVAIDIKPGGCVNSINLSNRGVIPVAVISSVSFDATMALPLTICFGDAEDASQRDCSEAHGRGHPEDVNRDARKDLVLHFDTLETGIDPGDSQACLTGQLPDGRVFAGCDSVRAF